MIKHTECDDLACWFCEGGLWGCEQCSGLEGGMPTECPGIPMTRDQMDQVYVGDLDFRAGGWRQETSQYSPLGLRQVSANYRAGTVAYSEDQTIGDIGTCPPARDGYHRIPCSCPS